MRTTRIRRCRPASQQGILSGMYLLQIGGRGKVRVTLFGSGTILREVLAAAQLLEKDYGVPADVFSVTSFSELRKERVVGRALEHAASERAAAAELRAADPGGPRGPIHRRHRLHEDGRGSDSPVGPGPYTALGTDGFGRSDSRAELRRFFEVDRHYVVVASLKALADEGKIDKNTVSKAMEAFGIDPEKSNPLTV
jgi:pyruvate dehydrogenase E1 component